MPRKSLIPLLSMLVVIPLLSLLLVPRVSSSSAQGEGTENPELERELALFLTHLERGARDSYSHAGASGAVELEVLGTMSGPTLVVSPTILEETTEPGR